MTGPINSLDVGSFGSGPEAVIRQVFVGGRGHGKTSYLAKLREQHAAVEAMYPPLPPAEVTGNLNVRWSCPRPGAE